MSVILPKSSTSLLPGDNHNRLTACGLPFRCYSRGIERRKITYCVMKCECGDVDVYQVSLVKNKNTKSCGCLNRENAKARFSTRDGMCVAHPEISHAWNNMKMRCYNSNHAQYANYGDRGISVCEEWRYSPVPFIEWSLTHGWAKGLEIDRINNNLGYYPGNCRWTDRETNLNNRRLSVLVTAFGMTKSVAQWSRSEICTITSRSLYDRLKAGWNSEKAISTPRTWKTKCNASN